MKVAIKKKVGESIKIILIIDIEREFIDILNVQLQKKSQNTCFLDL